MLIHGSELVAVAQGLVEYWDSRWIFSALRYDLKQASTSVHARNEQGYSQTLGPKCVRRNRCGRQVSGQFPFSPRAYFPTPVQL